MNLTIDIGNTCAKLVAIDKDSIIDESIAEGHDLKHLPGFAARHRFDAAILSSVIDLGDDARSTLATLPCPLLTFNHDTPVPIRNLYHTPTTLGLDRLAAAVWAAKDNPGRTSLIIDSGSCITFDLVSAKGEYVGGNIAPGVTARLRAIGEFFPRLPLVANDGALPDEGYDTETAIRSGCCNGAGYEIYGYIAHYSSIYKDLRVYLTGGNVSTILPSALPHSDVQLDHYIVTRGLSAILDYNQIRK